MEDRSKNKSRKDQKQKDLLAASQSGCIESRNALVEMASKHITAFFSSQPNQSIPISTERDDLSQEAILSFISGFHNWDPKKARFSTYVVSIATNVLRNAWKEHKKNREVPYIEKEDNEEHLKRLNATAAVREAIELLDGEVRDVVRLRTEGVSFTEIGTIIGRPEYTVRGMYKKGLGILRKFDSLENYNED